MTDVPGSNQLGSKYAWAYENRADAYEAKRETDLAKADRQVGWTS